MICFVVAFATAGTMGLTFDAVFVCVCLCVTSVHVIHRAQHVVRRAR